MSVESASNFVKPEIKDIKIIGQENLKGHILKNIKETQGFK